MRVRVLFRTHYQIDQPAHFYGLVSDCTSATKSEYPERVAKRLANMLDFNEAAALYAVDLARLAELVTDRMVWTPLGISVGLLVRHSRDLRNTNFELTAVEQMLALRVFLESDGATLLWLARRMLEATEADVLTEDVANKISAKMFPSIYDEYLQVIQGVPERQNLRAERDRIRSKGFTGKTGKHKLWLHFETLNKVGLCRRTEEERARTYACPTGTGESALRNLVRMLPDVMVLEKRASATELSDISAAIIREVLQLNATKIADADTRNRLLGAIREVRELGMNLCPISSVIDMVTFRGVSEGISMPTAGALRLMITQMNREDPRHVRLHVDRNGRPAFVVIDS